MRRMKNSELKEYLDGFPDNVDISVIIANSKERKRYPLIDYHGITDMGQPVLILEVGKSDKLDDEKDSDILGQIDFNDFPEVIP